VSVGEAVTRLKRAGGDTISFDTARIAFFDDAAIDVKLTREERTLSGGIARTGHIPGDVSSTVVMVDNGGVIHIAVSGEVGHFLIQGTPASGYVAKEFPPPPEINPHDGIKPPPLVLAAATAANSIAAAKAGEAVSNVNPKAVDDGSVIDVMVLYTPSALAGYGSKALIGAAIDANVALTNSIYANSDVVQRLRLVYKGLLNYTEGDVFADIATLNGKNGNSNALATLREITKADVVSVWGVWPQVCGIAYWGPTEHPSGAYSATHIVNAPLCTGPGSIVLAHELGHTMGLSHDPITSADVRAWVTPEGGGPSTEILYAAGYVDPVNRFRTIMAYDTCYTRFGYFCRLLPYFSNPLLSFNNSSFFAGAVNAPLGDSVTGNERQALNDTRDTVANYMPSRSLLPAAGVVSLIETYQTVQLAAGTATIQVARFGGSTGAVTVSYTSSPASYSANPPTHYAPFSGTLTWADGDDAIKTITVPLLRQGQLPDQEYFVITLASVSGGAEVGVPGTVRILSAGRDLFPPGGVVPAGYRSPGITPAERVHAWGVDYNRGYLSPASLASAIETAISPSEGSTQAGVSDLEYTGTFVGGNITFRHYVSGVAATATLEFSIDGTVVFTQAGGQTTWSQASIPVIAGQRTLRWRYRNTGTVPCAAPPGVAGCQDRAWIDDVVLPLSTERMSNFAWIADLNTNDVSAANPLTGEIAARVSLGAGTGPMGVATHPDGTRVYVANNGNNSVSVIDALEFAVVSTIAVGSAPIGIAVDPAGTRVYVVHNGASSIAVIDTSTNQRLADIAYAGGGTGIAINNAGTRAYVALGDRVQPIDLTNNVALTPVALGGGATAGGDANWPLGIAVRGDDAEVFVARNGVNSVAVLNVASSTITDSIATTYRPTGIAVNPRAPQVYIAQAQGIVSNNVNYGYGTLAMIDAYTHLSIGSAGIGQWPVGVAVNAEGTYANTTNRFGGTMTGVDLIVRDSINSAVPSRWVNPRSFGNFIAAASVPGRPGQLTAQPGNTQATLSFTPPSNDGGNTIARYDAVCSPGNVTGTALASPLVVTGLTNGTAYSCTVRAVNSRGGGRTSAAVSVTPSAATFFVSQATANFSVLTASSFSVVTGGAPATISFTGSLPAGVTLSAAGSLSGTPASGTVGAWPIVITAGSATQNFTLNVLKLNQVVTFPALASRRLLQNGAFSVSATGTPSGNAIVFSSATPTICTVSGNTVTPVTWGGCTVDAAQSSGIDHNQSPTVGRFTFVETEQTLTFAPTATLSAGASAPLLATSSVEGRNSFITYGSLTPTICTVSGATVTGVAVGACTVFADSPARAGGGIYAAPRVTQTFQVLQGTQVITVSTANAVVGQSTSRIVSSGGSGNPVVLATSTPTFCTVSGANFTPLRAGTCTLTANQAGNANYLPAAEVSFSVLGIPATSVARAYATATRLNDGKVLLAGGTNGLQTAEIYDPATGAWSATGGMSAPHQRHTATLLLDGRVLVVAGDGTATAEVYDPATGTWSSAGSLTAARTGHTATRLSAADGGRVVVTGGIVNSTQTRSVEIYDPATNTWSQGPSMLLIRWGHTAILMPNGRVMVHGGSDAGSTTNSAEIYNPATNSWAGFSGMNFRRAQHTATLMPDGKVLLAGGSFFLFSQGVVSYPYVVSERQDITSGASQTISSELRADHTATLLANGQVLMSGGSNQSNIVQATNLLFDSVSGAWTPAQPLQIARSAHTATLLLDGTVLIAGGNTTVSEIFETGFILLQSTLPVGTVGSVYPTTALSRAGGVAPFTHVVQSGSLPPGLTLTSAGVVSGTPTATGGYDFTVQVTDAGGRVATQTYRIDIGVVVTAQFSGPGTMSPSGAIPFAAGATPSFTLIPSTNVSLTMGGTCVGTLTGNVYTLAAVNADCTVTANFFTTPPSPPVMANASATNAQATVNFLDSDSDGGSTILNYVATSAPGGITGSCVAPCNTIVVTGLTNGTAYTFTVRGVNAAGTGVPSAASNTVTPRAPQVIVFSTIAPLSAGSSVVLAATGGGSGNPIVFTSASPTRCTVSGNVLTGIAAGTCAVRANQAGNAAFSAAPQVQQITTIAGLRTITPSVASGTGTISPSTPVSVANGATPTFTVTPGSGFSAAVGGTCGGVLSGNVYTVTAVTADCTVIATFTPGAVPDAPVIGVATPGNKQAAVSFTAPASNGGSAITSYTATCGPSSVSGASSPLVVTGLTNGTSYNCTVTATNAIGTSVASAGASVTPTSGIVLSSVVSRKTHGATGDFDLAIDTAQIISAAVTVEPRAIGTGHRIVFRFDRTVDSATTVTALDINNAAIGTASFVIAGNDIIVNLAGVPDATRVAVSLTGVNGTLTVSATLGFLVGDVNNSRSVNSSDINAIKTRSGQVVDTSNFKFDLNASGGINTTDINAAKTRSGGAL
jgi:YVTN family beta-propeller protein